MFQDEIRNRGFAARPPSFADPLNLQRSKFFPEEGFMVGILV